jgi:hypothetical protein
MTEVVARAESRLPKLTLDFHETYYIAGPMTGIEKYNYPAFQVAASELREMGLKILSPHEIPWPSGHEGMAVTELWTYMMRESKKLTMQATGLILLRGWPASRGALVELEKFTKEGQPVYYYDNQCLIDMNRWGT